MVYFMYQYTTIRADEVRMLKIKKIYNLIPNGLKWIIWMPMLIKLWWRNTLRDLIQDGKFSTWRNYAQVEAKGNVSIYRRH